MGCVNDLRSALALLREIPGQLFETNKEVDPKAELSGIYRHIGAGGTVMRPTKTDGPAMLFHNIKGHPDASVVIGVMASRERVARLFGCQKEELGHLLRKCAANPVMPVVSEERAPVQEIVHYSTDPDFDLYRLIPAPTNTPVDAGPYITLGMCYATHPDTGLSDVTIHRMCIQSRDELSIFLQPGSRHIGAMAERATELGKPLPVSVSIGVDPAISITSCFEPPTTPLGFNELSIAGALRGEPVKLTRCLSVEECAIANAEYVIEGEILPGSNHVVEDQNSHTGFAMPEFPGYNGPASHECWLLKVKAVTHRRNPIMQTCIGPSEEHVNMAGIPTEASILGMIDKALPGKVLNCYAHRSGGGKYLAVLQCRKTAHTDEGKQRQAALLAFSAFPELKHVILVDEDVDIFDTDDVLWAMNTRFQGDRDIITIPGVRCHPLDPSSNPAYSGSIRDIGISCKTIYDCTVPFELKKHFERAPFLEVDIDLSDDVKKVLDMLRSKGLKLAIGSSSRNTMFILKQIGLEDFFDAVSDGNGITRSKPDPEVFMKAAQKLELDPEECLVVEDAESGAQAGHAAGMKVVCVGDAALKKAGDYNLTSITELPDLFGNY